MHIDIQTPGFSLTDALCAHVRRRLQGVVEMRDRDVLRTSVRLTDINGPRGGVDKRCLLTAQVAGAPDIVARDTSENMYVAIDRAAQRLGRNLRRQGARQRRFKRLSLSRRQPLVNTQSLAV